MTGEMGSIDKSGKDSNGGYWPIHASIARQLKGELCPFDVYQGPYVYVYKYGREAYKFWVTPCNKDGGFADVYDLDRFVCIYEESQQRHSGPIYAWDKATNRRACKAARQLMKL